jgi:hypothetical protein
MVCTFKDNNQKCFFCKELCEKEGGEVSRCKYYNRQFPQDKETYDKRYRKALEAAIRKRNLLNEDLSFLLEKTPDYEKSIYDNVQKIIETIPVFTSTYKVKRSVDKSLLEGDILSNLAKNLYETHSLIITERYDFDNSFVCYIDDSKYRITVKPSLDEFISELKKCDNPSKFISENIINKIALTH